MAILSLAELTALLDEARAPTASHDFAEPDITTVAEIIRFSSLRVMPPAHLYVRKEDRILIQARNAVANAQLVVTGRIINSVGEVRTFLRRFSPTADRVPSNLIFSPGEGFLLNLTVYNEVVNILRGQCFVIGFYIAGDAVTDQVTAQILSDYIYTDYPVSYPFGVLAGPASGSGAPRVILGTNPPVGSEISETVPTRARWELVGFAVQLNTSAAVASRTMRLVINAGGSNELVLRASAVQTASQSVRYDLYVGSGWGVAADGAMVIPLPTGLFLPAGTVIATATDGFQAGDDYGTPQLSVNEWIEN